MTSMFLTFASIQLTTLPASSLCRTVTVSFVRLSISRQVTRFAQQMPSDGMTFREPWVAPFVLWITSETCPDNEMNHYIFVDDKT